MKLHFTSSTRTQAPVHPTQIVNREAKPDRSPIGRIVLIGGVIVLALVLAIWAWRSTRVYTYGVVATGLEAFHAPVRSRILSVYVEPGDRVKADQALFLLVSEDAAAEMKENQELLAQQQRVLEVGEAAGRSLFDDPIQELRDLQAAQVRVQALVAELPRLELEHRTASSQHEADVATAQHRVEHLVAVATTRANHHQRVVHLHSLDAASLDQLRDAEERWTEAQFAADAAKRDLEQRQTAARLGALLAEGTMSAHTRAVQQAQTYLTEMETTYHTATELRQREKERGIENIRSRITSLEARIAHLRTLAGPTEVRSLADGVVTEVLASEGSNVPKDGMILTVAGTGKVWINAFIPPERVQDVEVGNLVHIYPTTGAKRLTGKVTASGGIQYKVHPSLHGHISELSAVYVRIDLEEGSPELIPGNVAKVVIK